MPVDIPPDSELPSYYHDDSLSLPSYSSQLVNGEQRLDHTPRSQAARSRPSGIYVKNLGKMSVVLDDQEENVTTPVFGRRAVISGNLSLGQEQLDSIRKIVLKVEGKLDSACSSGGDRSVTLINSSHTLWSHLTSQECLPQIPFSIRLPSTFQDGDNSSALPPSFHVQPVGALVVNVQSVYQLHFIVTRIRHHKLDILPKEQCITIPFKYVPRARPPRPIVQVPSFLSPLRSSPEEWHQATTSLKMRPGFDVDPITCRLFVPAGRIYGLTDTIHFHVQLTGQTCSLHKLFSGTDLDRANSNSSVKPKNRRPFIRVTLLRQVIVALRKENSGCNFILGEGPIRPIPLGLSSCGTTCQCSEGNIDWDGELRCRSDVTAGGFNAANVHVQDFIVLSIFPPTPKSPLLELELGIPVRLVTDSFSDTVAQMDFVST